MCGRTCLSLNEDQIRCACSYKPRSRSKSTFTKPELIHEHNDGNSFVPSHNIAPTEVTPVLVSASKYRNGSETDRILKPMMWGVVPPWHKGDYRSHNLSTNNCRLENLKTSKLYYPLLKKGGRCVIVVEGFYEWQTTNKSSKVKQPYYIYAPQVDGVQIDEPETWDNHYTDTRGWYGVKLLHMAGVYNVWKDDDKVIYSYSVITMESNSVLSWLHHRMPAILDTEEQITAWLNIDGVDLDTALSVLRPVKMLSYHPVSTLVNNSRNKSEECNKRVIEKKNSSQTSLTSWLVKSEKRRSSGNDGSMPKKAKIN